MNIILILATIIIVIITDLIYQSYKINAYKNSLTPFVLMKLNTNNNISNIYSIKSEVSMEQNDCRAAEQFVI